MTQGSIVRSISYTADGNTLQNNSGTGTVFSYAYNNDNRLVQVSLGGVTQASYTLNYLGQRVIKSAVTSGTTDFHYDRFGHLIAESDGAGNVLREYVFLGDAPVAFITPTGGIDIIHTDHLGTPQKMTDATQAVVWDGGASDPFMMSALPTTPAMNVRFPGQYFDGESGLHQNGFRDFDPNLGRYFESDPIGLGGGGNTYTYVGHNPVKRFDPLGLYAIVFQHGNDISIQLPIQYQGASDAQIAAYNSAIQNTWSGDFGRYHVTTTVTTPGDGVPSDEKNVITVKPGPSNGFPGNFNMGNNTGNFNSTIADDNPQVAAHEAGHMMGDLDHYIDLRDPDTGQGETFPWPGYDNDIMANLNGRPTEDDISHILHPNSPDNWAPGDMFSPPDDGVPGICLP